MPAGRQPDTVAVPLSRGAFGGNVPAIPHRERKVNRTSMSRGLFSPLSTPSQALPLAPHTDALDSGKKCVPHKWCSENAFSVHPKLETNPLFLNILGMSGGRGGVYRPGLFAAACFTAFLACSGSAHAQSAKTWDKRGAAAELRQDYDTAYEDYKKAHNKNPKEMLYLSHFERMRFLASVQHVDRGRLLREGGDWNGAMEQFLRAREIDPSNQAAEQEIAITQRDQPPPTLSGPAAAAAMQQNSQQHKVQQEISAIAGPIQLKPVSNDPITYHAVEDVKNIYTSIGKLAGLNVIFDPEYTSKRIPVDLTNVTLSEALRIVGTISNTFYKPITPNTIFVAQNSRTKRTDLDELAVQTFYLANSSQPNDGNEILTGLRLLLDPSVKLYLVPSQNAIVMRATPNELLLAQKLINDFDRARAEVVVDVAVLEVNRDKLRNLGITLPTSIGLTPQLPTTTTTSTSTTTNANTSSSFTLSNLVNSNSNDFAVNVSGGTLNALLTDTDTRVLQNPRIRATDGQKASLKIGQKIPIATGSYNAGVSTGVASIGVQTQFTYIDVGVNIEITPTVHLDREVTLKTKVEVSQQNGSVTISSVTEPIIAQRVLEQSIQLKEGEPSIMAGIVTKQDLKTVSGTPGLGEIPFFKFFFSSQSKEVQTDEIVFLLIPHIVRESVLTQANLAAIDTGTSSDFELRASTDANAVADADKPVITAPPSVASPSTAANAASAALQQMNQQAQPARPGVTGAAFTAPGALPTAMPQPDATSGGFAAPVTLSLTPSGLAAKVGESVQVSVGLQNGQDIYSVPMQLQYNPRVLQLVNVDAGDLLQKDGKPATVVHRDDGNGQVTIGATRPPQASGVTGSGNVCNLTFRAVGVGDSSISFVKVGAKNSAQVAIAATGSPATIHVQ
jgi:general secretion pathway protein D